MAHAVAGNQEFVLDCNLQFSSLIVATTVDGGLAPSNAHLGPPGDVSYFSAPHHESL